MELPDLVGTLKSQKLNNKENLDAVLASFQIPVERVADVKSTVYDLPKWVGQNPRKETLAKLSKDSSSHYKMMFLGETDDSILLGILDPEISGINDAANFLSNSKIICCFINGQDSINRSGKQRARSSG